MSTARIESIEALKNLRMFLCTFARDISVALDEADFDIRQTLAWLQHDQYPHWKNELRTRSEQLVKAKLELKRKQYLEKTPVGGHSSYIDEKKALAVAQRRFDEAEDKLNKIRGWIPKLEKEGDACRGALQGLSSFVHVDIPNRTAQIDQMIYSLESYINVSAPSTAAPDMSVAINAGQEADLTPPSAAAKKEKAETAEDAENAKDKEEE